MNRVPDRPKMRREYLRKQLDLRATFAAGRLLTICAGGGAGYFLFATASAVFSPGLNDGFERSCTVSLFGLVVTGACMMLGEGIARSARRRRLHLRYVPPVGPKGSEHPEEVLLRGADNSSAASTAPDELVRPAGSEVTSAEELLRASAGE